MFAQPCAFASRQNHASGKKHAILARKFGEIAALSPIHGNFGKLAISARKS
jgi:hypothetical protein